MESVSTEDDARAFAATVQVGDSDRFTEMLCRPDRCPEYCEQQSLLDSGESRRLSNTFIRPRDIENPDILSPVVDSQVTIAGS